MRYDTILYSTFEVDKLGKIRGHHWKERLKISKIDKFESDLLTTNKDKASQSSEILQTFVWWGLGTDLSPIIKTSVNDP